MCVSLLFRQSEAFAKGLAGIVFSAVAYKEIGVDEMAGVFEALTSNLGENIFGTGELPSGGRMIAGFEIGLGCKNSAHCFGERLAVLRGDTNRFVCICRGTGHIACDQVVQGEDRVVNGIGAAPTGPHDSFHFLQIGFGQPAIAVDQCTEGHLGEQHGIEEMNTALCGHCKPVGRGPQRQVMFAGLLHVKMAFQEFRGDFDQGWRGSGGHPLHPIQHDAVFFDVADPVVIGGDADGSVDMQHHIGAGL